MRIADFFQISGVGVDASTLANDTTTNTDSLSLKVGNEINHYVNLHLIGADFGSSSLSIQPQQSDDGSDWVNVPDVDPVALDSVTTSGSVQFITSAPYLRLAIAKTGTDALTLIAKALASKDVTAVQMTYRIDDTNISAAELAVIDGVTAGSISASKAAVVGADKKVNEWLVDNVTINGNDISTTDTNGNLTLTPHGTGITKTTKAVEVEKADNTGNVPALVVDNNDTTNNPTALKIENAGSGKDIETEALDLTNGKITLIAGTGFEIESASTGNAVALTVDQNDTTGNNVALVIENAGSGNDITAPSFTLKAGAIAGTSLTVNSVAIVATPAEINSACDTSTRLVAAGATLSATVALHQEKIISLDTAAGSIVTLPAAAGTGARFRFAVTTTATSNSHVVKVANAADTMVGLINVFDQDGTAAGIYQGSGTDDTITMNRTTTGGIIGDYLEVIDLAANKWLVQGAITCVAGSDIADPFSATVA